MMDAAKVNEDARKAGLIAANEGLPSGEVRSILSIDYHRNGISGVGFSVVRFTMKEEDKRSPTTMIGIVFSLTEPEKWNGYCAILRASDITEGTLRMHEDGAAWRGDHFESDLRKALERYDAAWDAVIFAK